MNMRVNYQPLNEAQLHRLLQGYNLVGKSPPYCWRPPPEDRHQALQEGELLSRQAIVTPLEFNITQFSFLIAIIVEDILLEMSGHPPFLFPQDCGVIDLAHPPDDKEFWTNFKKLYSQYGVAEGIVLPFL